MTRFVISSRELHGRRPSGDGGFTLIEVITVMVIVGILAAVAAPAMNSIEASRGRTAARSLYRDVCFAREWAVATGNNTWVVFDEAAESWTILTEDPANPGRASAAVIDDPATGRTFVQTLGSGDFTGLAVTSAAFDGDTEIGFDWLGRPLNATETSLASQGVVTLSNSAQVTVAVTTGSIALVQP